MAAEMTLAEVLADLNSGEGGEISQSDPPTGPGFQKVVEQRTERANKLAPKLAEVALTEADGDEWLAVEALGAARNFLVAW
jgi:hypothetical protein